ncbi:hypothetical protein CYMTET_51670 [Cymbomonas tetramitiformis]|uniref:Uncharacterized protein n=1 Tax=Cymbomonas tetramitiformis TaxID=36881 RepID=A0AAE0BM97_9CHLO|nr:hypothetical protein CYMTET_51670 [Cymbomonas tetramitiformis]
MDEGRGGAVHIGGLTPEQKAGEALVKLFTFVAARTIMAEIEGYDNEGGSAASHPVWRGMQDALTSEKGIDENFITDMMRSPDHDMQLAAVRLLEVRTSFAQDTFQWDVLRAAAISNVQADAERVMAQYMSSIVPLDTDACGE